MLCKILVSCIPVAIVGLCFKDFVESFFGGDLFVVGVCLCSQPASVFWPISSALVRHCLPYRGGRDITWIDAFVIGCAQAVAVLPGLSRSGTTIATGIPLGDNREKMASFSFLMVIILSSERDF